MTHLCFDVRDDARLANAWPHCVELVDGHPHDRRAETIALTTARSRRRRYDVLWPREIAYRWLRASVTARFDDVRLRLAKRNVQTAVATPGAPTQLEAKSWLIAATVDFGMSSREKAEDLVYIVETILGPDETLDAIATGFEQATTDINRRGTGIYIPACKAAIAETLAFVLHRASTTAREKHIPRFATQHARFAKAASKNREWIQCAAAFELSLMGAAGVKRRFGAQLQLLRYLDFAGDDPTWVLERVLAEPSQPCSVRVVAIAGAEAMTHLPTRKFDARDLASALRDFGMIRAKESVAFALSLLGRSVVKDVPLAWLVEHAEYARPFVERAAARSPKSDLARAALRHLTAASHAG